MKTQGKVISADRLTAYEQWELPVMEQTGGRADISSRPMTASQLEAVHRQAHEEGYAQGRQEGDARGYREGQARGRAELEAQAERLRGVLRCFADPLEELDETVEDTLVALATSVARHLVRRELKLDPGQVIAVVREAMGVLPVGATSVRLYLHPDDAALVRELLPVNEREGLWQIVEEPVMTRGGCRVMSTSSQVDATVEGRVAAVVAHTLGEERDGDAE